VLIVASGCFMAGWTWGTWADIQVDFGREVYIAWRISQGDALYRDLAYYNGPLSPHLNALWFLLFGVAIRTLVICNLLVLAGITWLLHALLRQVGSRLAATTATLVFVLVFAFGQYVFAGNYNYVCPYSHDAVHGVLLSLASLHCLARFARRPAIRWPALGGGFLGLVFLTRSEVFLAAALGTLAQLLAILRLRTMSRRGGAKAVGVFFACSAVPPLLAFLLLALRLPLQLALIGTLGTWPATLSSPVASLRFFQGFSGLLDPAAHLALMLEWTAGYAAVFLPTMAVAMRMRGRGVGASVVALGFTFGLLTWWWRDAPPLRIAMPLPLFLAGGCVAAAVAVIRRRMEQPGPARPALRLGLHVFALVLLLKLGLFCRIHHYGFYLALPGVMLLVVALLDGLPGWVDRRGGSGPMVCGTAFGAILAFVVTLLVLRGSFLGEQTARVAAGGDVLRADAVRGEAFQIALQQIEQRIGRDETLVAFPEGVMLNFLSRRRNPTPHTNFMPTEIVLFGEDSILALLQAHPPDWVALVHKDTSEFGFRFFGRDYAVRIGEWIEQNYRPVHGIGSMPLQTDAFGILLLKRAPAAPRPPAGSG
jgi:hypothetical protein